MIKLKFLGAARNVTGSCYCLESDGQRLLIDCGLVQEREYRNRNWDPFPIPPETIDALLLTHAHLDHSGLIPKLVREGFKGKIYATAATSDISEIMLLDAAKLQEEDAAFKQKRHQREGRRGPFPEIPLYDTADAERSLKHFAPVNYGEPLALGGGIRATFHDAGHVLGSAMIKLTVSDGNEERTVLFSGDVGRWQMPILRDPTVFSQADYVIVESTYGDRLHEGVGDIDNDLAEVINSTFSAQGNIVIPSFALERAQDLLYHLNELIKAHRIPRLITFMDSPMAINITEVFERHPELFDKEMTQTIKQHQSLFDLPGLKMVRSTEDSKAINSIRGTAIIIAGSGMCTGGRIKHHLFNNITRPQSTILFIGYQATGTLGRQIVEGAPRVRILGEYLPVEAKIKQIHGFSAHADRDELLRWLSGLKAAPRRVFITHGEAEAAESFAGYLSQKTGWKTLIPHYKQEVNLE
jgi:metallo-beta-lactamase family protein